jgi:formyltetrahydrofolate deformylase
MENYVLLIDGQDEKGLIHKITGAIYYQGLNIVSNSEFVDPKSNHFFMRSEFNGDINPEVLVAKLREILNHHFNIRLTQMRKKRIVLMASKEHHCLADLLIREEYGNLNAEIVAVISNSNVLEPLVQKFKKKFHHIPHDNLSREQHEAEILKVIGEYKPDYIVLAKYMRIFTPEFVKPFENRIVNIHHSFLPAFIGVNPYEQAYERGVKMIGATSHFVSENLDEGPIIVQEIIHIDHKFSAEDMRQAGRDVEVLTFAKALKLVFEERVFINGNKTVIFE